MIIFLYHWEAWHFQIRNCFEMIFCLRNLRRIKVQCARFRIVRFFPTRPAVVANMAYRRSHLRHVRQLLFDALEVDGEIGVFEWICQSITLPFRCFCGWLDCRPLQGLVKQRRCDLRLVRLWPHHWRCQCWASLYRVAWDKRIAVNIRKHIANRRSTASACGFLFCSRFRKHGIDPQRWHCRCQWFRLGFQSIGFPLSKNRNRHFRRLHSRMRIMFSLIVNRSRNIRQFAENGIIQRLLICFLVEP